MLKRAISSETRERDIREGKSRHDNLEEVPSTYCHLVNAHMMPF